MLTATRWWLLGAVPHLLFKGRKDLFQSAGDLVIDLPDARDFFLQLRMVQLYVVQQVGFKLLHFINWDIVQVSVDAGVNRQHLIGDRHWLVLSLLEQLDHPNAARKLHLRRFVELAAELRERGHFSVLREVEPKGTSHLLHGLDLSRAPDA